MSARPPHHVFAHVSITPLDDAHDDATPLRSRSPARPKLADYTSTLATDDG